MQTLRETLDIAEGQIGTVESPAGTNKQKYGLAFGTNGVQWCAIFVWWVFRQAGFAPYKSAYVPDVMAYFKRTNSFYTAPRVGDIAIFQFTGNVPDHCGIIESVGKTGIVTIEGNTALSNQNNGGAVMRRNRSYGATIVGYGRPFYASEVPKVQPQHNPAIVLEPIVAELACLSGGVWLVSATGAVYAFGGAPYRGGAHDQSYFKGRTAARLEPGTDGHLYTIVASSGERYDY